MYLPSNKWDSSYQFQPLFAGTIKLGQQLHGEIYLSCLLQELWVNKYIEAILQYPLQRTTFKSLSDEFLSHVISQLEDRFFDNPAHSVALGLLYLLPSECDRVESDGILPCELAQAADLHLPHSTMLCTEYGTWVMRWKQQQAARADVPTNTLHVVNYNSLT